MKKKKVKLTSVITTFSRNDEKTSPNLLMDFSTNFIVLLCIRHWIFDWLEEKCWRMFLRSDQRWCFVWFWISSKFSIRKMTKSDFENCNIGFQFIRFSDIRFQFIRFEGVCSNTNDFNRHHFQTIFTVSSVLIIWNVQNIVFFLIHLKRSMRKYHWLFLVTNFH